MTTALDTRPLSIALREETANAHDATEGSDFMSRLIDGKQDEKAVAMYTAQLWYIYDALERAIRSFADSPLLESLADPRLERRETLESDLNNLVGKDWRETIPVLPATKRYAEHLEKLDSAHAAVAHHYVRYLGDFSGGQVIAARMKKNYGMDSNQLSFYDFSNIGKPVPFRRAYRLALDSLELTDKQRSELIAEAGVAFRLNLDVFNALDEQTKK